MIKQETIIAMLLGHAVGDAMGVPVERTSRWRLEINPVVDMRGYGTNNQPPGSWSGDTSLTIATMDSLSRRKNFDYEDIMINFVNWYNGNLFTANDITFDCDPVTASAIDNFLRGSKPLDSGICDEYSNENGALIRISPAVAYIFMTRGNNFDAEAMTLIHNLSKLTHAHPRTLIACGIYSLILAEVFDGQNLQAAFENGLNRAKNFYSEHPDFQAEWSHYDLFFDKDFAAITEKNIVPRVYVIDNLKAALWCLLNTNNYRELILKAVNLGGDADTIAAIAGGIGGAFYGLEQIPAEWLAVLRKKDYLEKIATDFYNAFEKEMY